jgi:hypothetical protein
MRPARSLMPANKAIQKFMDQDTVPLLFVATGATVALKNWDDKAFVRVNFDQPISHFGYDQATRAKRGVFRPVYPKRA